MKPPLKVLGDRKLAYILLSLLLEPQDFYLVVSSKEKDAVLAVLEKLKELSEPYKNSLIIKIKNVDVLDEEEYYRNWRNYSGKRVLLLEDYNLKWDLLDEFSKYIKDSIKRKLGLEVIIADILSIIYHVSETLNRVKAQIGSLENKIRFARDILNERIDDKRALELATKLIEYVLSKMPKI